MGAVRRLVPDLDDELCHALGQVEELLLTLAVWEDDPDQQLELPIPLVGRVALDALNRVQGVIATTQSRDDKPAGGGRLLGPDGRYEHRPLRVVVVDDADLATLSGAAAALGRALATDPYGELAEVMAAGAEAAAPTYGPAPQPGELVEAFARALGVLDLAATDDTRLLIQLITDAGGDVVLDPVAEASYQRTADRFNAMWAHGSGLDRFLF